MYDRINGIKQLNVEKAFLISGIEFALIKNKSLKKPKEKEILFFIEKEKIKKAYEVIEKKQNQSFFTELAETAFNFTVYTYTKRQKEITLNTYKELLFNTKYEFIKNKKTYMPIYFPNDFKFSKIKLRESINLLRINNPDSKTESLNCIALKIISSFLAS